MKFQTWCLQNLSTLNLEIIKLNWTQEFFPDYYDFSASIIIDGYKLEGFGFDKNQDIAITKAIVEAIERSAIQGDILTSNGLAAHTDIKIAEKNAKNEIIERDLFLSHFYTSTPFIKVLNDEFKIPDAMKKYIENNGDFIDLYKTKKSNYGSTYICVISNQVKWGGIVSIQLCQDDSSEDILKCLINASRSYRFEKVSGGFDSQISLETFNEQHMHNFKDHQSLSMNVDYFNKINFLFKNKNLSNNVINYSDLDFKFEKILLTSSLKKCPLHIIRCVNDTTVSLVAGHFSKHSLPDAIKERFLNNNDYEFNNLPHPLS